jgi:hypothetical protein
MSYLHNICEGRVEVIVGFDGCYDDNYGRCLRCGIEGELIAIDTKEAKGFVFVSIQSTTRRHKLPANDPA